MVIQINEYHLYRLKFIKPAQALLFQPEKTARQIFELALEEKPSHEMRENNVWRIANIKKITGDGGKFAVGRVTSKPVEKFDGETGNFTEFEDNPGPYTYVYFDSKIGLLAIGKKPKVAAEVSTIARMLKKLFEETKTIKEFDVSVKVDPIPDPSDFIEKILRAYAIKKFRAEFTGPNPIDADEVFQKPLSYLCQTLDADKGSVSLTGSSLDNKAVISIAKSTAATGNRVFAKIEQNKGQQAVQIRFKRDARKLYIDNQVEEEKTLKKVQESYGEIWR